MTATSWWSFNIARCTCAIDAAATGCSSNDKNLPFTLRKLIIIQQQMSTFNISKKEKNWIETYIFFKSRSKLLWSTCFISLKLQGTAYNITNKKSAYETDKFFMQQINKRIRNKHNQNQQEILRPDLAMKKASKSIPVVLVLMKQQTVQLSHKILCYLHIVLVSSSPIVNAP